ncbi:MAG: type II secretion system F family protein [Candidatus Vogelbacteria bacterium]|nr:type II secretion system F family protein [Candidatus Vogelbacteria bacterium]
MKLYYRAKKLNGEEVTGTHESTDRFALTRELKEKDLTVFFVSEKPLGAGQRKILSLSWLGFLFKHISLKEKIIFVKNLGVMIGSGLSLTRTLSVLERQTGSSYLRKIISDLNDKINGGQNLSTAFANYPNVFSEILVAMTAVGEETGKLPETLKTVSEQLTKNYELRRKVSGALIYPAIVIIAIVVIGILMMVYLIPSLTNTFKEMKVDLPFTTKMMIWGSDFFVNNLYLILASGGIFIVALVLFFRTKTGLIILDRLILTLPFFGHVTRWFNSAVILRNVSSLINSGVSMTKTIEITERVTQNHYYKQVMKEALIKVQKGASLSSVFNDHANLFPVFAIELTAVGEETGRLPEMLLQGAIFYEEEVEQVTKNISSVIEPILMIVIGIAVGFFAVSMLGPMYSLSSAIK